MEPKRLKRCPKCGAEHSRGNLRRFQSYCARCHAAYMRKHRPGWKELTPEQRRKATARRRAELAHRKRKPCRVRGCRDRAERHHPDYNKPLEVVWLCRKHHLREHQRSARADQA